VFVDGIEKIEMIKNRNSNIVKENCTVRRRMSVDMFYVQFVMLFNNIKNVFTLRLEMQERKYRSLISLSLSTYYNGTIERRREREKEKKMNEQSLTRSPSFVLKLTPLWTEEIYRETEKRADDDDDDDQYTSDKKRRAVFSSSTSSFLL
jgi:hypothetical protein